MHRFDRACEPPTEQEASRMRVKGILAAGATAILTACGDHSMPTEPPAPFEIAGRWQGTASSEGLATGCAASEPVAVTATFTQTGEEVHGTLSGGCLAGATFEGRFRDRSLLGVTHLAGNFDCDDTANTSGSGLAGQLTLRISVGAPVPSLGCRWEFGRVEQHGTVTLELTR